VKDDKGNIVLQVKALPDRIQIQGEWWQNQARGIRLVAAPTGCGANIQFFGPSFRPEQGEPIRPIFMYPSETHFGELKK
jgi:hypothetical protein